MQYALFELRDIVWKYVACACTSDTLRQETWQQDESNW